MPGKFSKFDDRVKVKTKRIYREIFILRHMKHPDVINLKNIVLPTNYETFRDLYLVRRSEEMERGFTSCV